MSNKKKTLLISLAGLATGIFLVPPLLSALGVPGFDALLNSLFGENSLIAVIVSFLLILLVIFMIVRFVKKEDTSTGKES